MKIVEMNAQSVKQTDPQKLGNIDIQPHYVSLILPCYISIIITMCDIIFRFQK